jgi:ATP-dependent helicase/nuclease subunit A
MPGGNQRQANLRILFERARQFEETSFKGLFNFINYINKLKSSKGDMGSAKILGENENVIRIMSIHKSKGLEFPVVFVSGCGKQFNMQDMNKKMLLHQDIGFGPDFVDYRRRLTYASLPKQAVRYKIKVETLSEEMRVLYVALTRSREKLIITGCIDSIEKTVKKWAEIAADDKEKLPFYDMIHARKYLDWLGPALIRHQDCKLLRDSIGLEKYHKLNDSSIWSIHFWGKDEVTAPDVIAAEEQAQPVGQAVDLTPVADQSAN